MLQKTLPGLVQLKITLRVSFFFGARESNELTLEDAPLLIIGLNLRGGRVVRCSVRVYIAVITFRFDHFFDRTMSKWEVSGAFSMVVKLR